MNGNIEYEDLTPNPELLIKSIAEQGYSLESALADLIDNSISANADKIEILIDTESQPFTLFLADNGDGMTKEELTQNMRFPSNSIEADRSRADLGRFGLGMKTASFSQTRSFTVISKKKTKGNFSARTWDVDYLRQKNKWWLIKNTKEEIDSLILKYSELSRAFLKPFPDFKANTIVVWKGLYKFENYIQESNRKKALQKQLTEITSDYLSIVFHRFMERKNPSLQIKINNLRLRPFNPFPTSITDFRSIESKQRGIDKGFVKLKDLFYLQEVWKKVKEIIIHGQ